MDNNDLKKLNRRELLEMLYEQSRQMDLQREEIEDLKEQLDNKLVIKENSGSIADAVLELSKIFDAAQDAADIYVSSVERSLNIKGEMVADMDVFKRSLRVSILYADKLKKEMRELNSHFNEFSKILRIMEGSLK